MLKLALLALTLMLSLLPVAVGSWTELGLFIGLMALTGIPHGATDHLVYEKVHGQMNWRGFLRMYLGSMLVYALLWWALPHMSLLLFLGLSAYHFGESQFLRYDLSHWPRWTKGWVALWGIWVLMLIIGGHEIASVDILNGMLLAQDSVAWIAANHMLMLTVMGVPLLLGGIMLAFGKFLSWRALGMECLMMAALIFLNTRSSLMVSFAVYFGLWHACQSIEGELAGLREAWPGFGLWDWVKAAWPFSVISFGGLGFLLAGLPWWGAHISPLLVFFILISVLTLPHMQLMERLYRKQTNGSMPLEVKTPLKG
ncbi:MAG: Brp/Blh family beta-carotene 15,15'-dioxygenase [Bacteroidota bacterium]